MCWTIAIPWRSQVSRSRLKLAIFGSRGSAVFFKPTKIKCPQGERLGSVSIRGGPCADTLETLRLLGRLVQLPRPAVCADLVPPITEVSRTARRIGLRCDRSARARKHVRETAFGDAQVDAKFEVRCASSI
eukprot:610572-Pyramimonas_sp.AAC.1